MGSGKSYWVRQWASYTTWDYIDTDKAIEQQEGLLVADIFKQKSEAYFRKAEAGLIRSLPAKENLLVACGGGLPCHSGNMAWMNELGHTIYLKATVDYILQMLESSSKSRPLLKDLSGEEMRTFVTELLNQRKSVYELAHTIVDVDKLDNNNFLQLINQKG